jgi:uncharacterized protein
MTALKQHPVASFLVATYALVVVVFAAPLLGTSGLGVISADIPVTPFLLISTILLAVTAAAVPAAADGRAGVRELRARAFKFRVSPVWYVVALVALPLATFGVAVVLHGATAAQAIAGRPSLPVDWLISIVSLFLLINLWEEIGWTGFVLDRLQRRFGPVRATVLTTWAQAAFHIPLIFIVGGVSDARIAADQYPFYFAALFIFPLGNRLVATWLYNASRRSVPVVGLMHASWNLAAGTAFLPALVPGMASLWAYIGFAAVAAVLLAVTRGRLGYVARDATATAATSTFRRAAAVAR